MLSYISLDLETTGFSPYNNEIIQVSAWKVEEGLVTDKFNTYVKPIQYIPREVQSITGITPSMVADAPSVEEVLPEFCSFCGDFPFLGHNLSFDYNFLLVKGKWCGVDFSLNGARTGIDTLKLAKKIFPNLKKYSLEDLVQHFKVSVGDPKFHDASFDSYVTKLIYDRFCLMDGMHGVSGLRIPVLLTDKKKEYGEATNNSLLSFE